MAVTGITITIDDGVGGVQAYHQKIPSGATVPQVAAYAQRLAERVDAISDGVITSIEYTTQVDLPGGLKADAATGADVEEGGLFTFNCSGTVYKDSVRIPAFAQSKFVGKAVDITDDDVVAFVGLLTTGEALAGATLHASNPYENTYLSLSKTKKSFRR